MQPLERAVAIFCIACICAELTTQLAGSTWARRHRRLYLRRRVLTKHSWSSS